MKIVEPNGGLPHCLLDMASNRAKSPGLRTSAMVVMAALLALVPAAAPAVSATPSAIASPTLPVIAPPAAPVSAVGAPRSSVADYVAQFYAGRQNAPLWLREGPRSSAAAALLRILRRAPIDGFAFGPQLATQAEAAMVRAESGTAADIRQAELLFANAWVRYVQGLNGPTAGMIYGDATVAPTIPTTTRILHQAASAPSLSVHLEEVSNRNPIYAALRQAALDQTGEANAATRATLIANLDRARVLPAGGRFVLVDIAAARLWMYEEGKPIDSMKVIVGMSEYQTPMIASVIHYATLNPYWHVPDHLVRKTVAPNVLKQGPGYLKARGYEILSSWAPNAPLISPSDIDWAAVAKGTSQIIVRQLPGGGNSMGKMKFPFANGAGIYLHDTPNKALFDKDQRSLSNGCIRLEDAPRLARWLFGYQPVAPLSSPEQHVQLPRRMPIYVTYLTAHPTGDGKIGLVRDVYGMDARSASRTAAAAVPAGVDSLKFPAAAP